LEIKVKVHAKSSRSQIIEKDSKIHIYVHSPPDKGKANKEVIKLISEYFHVPVSQINLMKGQKSTEKVFRW